MIVVGKSFAYSHKQCEAWFKPPFYIIFQKIKAYFVKATVLKSGVIVDPVITNKSSKAKEKINIAMQASEYACLLFLLSVSIQNSESKQIMMIAIYGIEYIACVIVIKIVFLL